MALQFPFFLSCFCEVLKNKGVNLLTWSCFCWAFLTSIWTPFSFVSVVSGLFNLPLFRTPYPQYGFILGGCSGSWFWELISSLFRSSCKPLALPTVGVGIHLLLSFCCSQIDLLSFEVNIVDDFGIWRFITYPVVSQLLLSGADPMPPFCLSVGGNSLSPGFISPAVWCGLHCASHSGSAFMCVGNFKSYAIALFPKSPTQCLYYFLHVISRSSGRL